MAKQFASTIADSNPTSLTITSLPSSRKLKLVVLGAFFVFFGSGILSQLLKQNVYIILYVLAAFFFIPALITIILPIDFKLSISSAPKGVAFIKEYISGLGLRPRYKEVQLEVESVEFGFMEHRRDSPALVRMYSNGQALLLMNFSRRTDDLRLVRSRLQSFGTHRLEEKTRSNEIATAEPGLQADPIKHSMHEMQRGLVSWRNGTIIMGFFHFIATGFLAPSWGIVLISLGLASFYFREAAMVAVYAFVLGWVGLGNMLLSGSVFWLIFGGYQIFLGVRLLKRFRHYQREEKEHLSATEGDADGEKRITERAAKLFPRLGCVMSVATLSLWAIFLLLMVAAILAASEGAFSFEELTASEPPAVITIVLVLTVGIGESLRILGLAFSVASLLAGFKPKWMVWGGVLAGGAFALFYFGLIIWGKVVG